MTHTFIRRKPEGTFYVDYIIQDGKCYLIFEHDVRVTTKFICRTNKTMCKDLRETNKSVIIEI